MASERATAGEGAPKDAVAASPGTGKRASLGAMCLAFGKVGLVSFGGGSTTLVLMEQEVVRRRCWMTSREFMLSMALSRMWPGVHLIAQAVLIGYMLRGFAGGMACLFGMMVPATAITVLFTAFIVVLRENPLGAGAIGGVLPATAGLALAVAYRFARGEVKGLSPALGGAVVVLAVGSFALMAFFHVSSVLAVLGAGVLAIFIFLREEQAHGPA